MAGTLADCAAIMGFYAEFLYFQTFDVTSRAPRRQSLLSAATRAAGGLPGWLASVAPWLEKALLAGVVFGLIGWWWGRSRSPAAGAVVCLAFVLEPGVRFVQLGYVPRPYAVWVTEALAGALAVVWVATSRRTGSAT